MNTLIVIVGPTGIGKTELCIKIAERFNVPIINADSRQIFKEIPIGTAAPTNEEMQRATFFFAGIKNINEYYNASMFEKDVIKTLDEIFATKDRALMCGGCMMYIDAVCNGIDDIPNVKQDIRNEVQEEYREHGIDKLRHTLKSIDPDYYNIVDLNNHKRIVHAIEICLSTGNTYSSYRTNTKKLRPFRIIKIGLNMERKQLYDRIDRRVDKMIRSGLIEEAKSMYPFRQQNALNTVGYKELFNFFDGNSSLEEAIFKIKSNTHKYCRKQITWFKRDNSIKWFSPDNIEEIINYINALDRDSTFSYICNYKR